MRFDPPVLPIASMSRSHYPWGRFRRRSAPGLRRRAGERPERRARRHAWAGPAAEPDVIEREVTELISRKKRRDSLQRVRQLPIRNPQSRAERERQIVQVDDSCGAARRRYDADRKTDRAEGRRVADEHRTSANQRAVGIVT